MPGTNLDLPPCGGFQNDVPGVWLRSEEVSYKPQSKCKSDVALRVQSGGKGLSPGM